MTSRHLKLNTVNCSHGCLADSLSGVQGAGVFDFMDGNNSDKAKRVIVISIASFLFAFVGFSYNVWRTEKTEDNNNVREASFGMLQELANLEQLVYAIHYDHRSEEGTPRNGWVKVGLIQDMSMLVAPSVESKAAHLKEVWAGKWSLLAEDKQAADEIVQAIEDVRAEARLTLKSLN